MYNYMYAGVILTKQYTRPNITVHTLSEQVTVCTSDVQYCHRLSRDVPDKLAYMIMSTIHGYDQPQA